MIIANEKVSINYSFTNLRRKLLRKNAIGRVFGYYLGTREPRDCLCETLKQPREQASLSLILNSLKDDLSDLRIRGLLERNRLQANIVFDRSLCLTETVMIYLSRC